MSERIEFNSTLINKFGCEDNEVKLSWGVTCSALVTIDAGAWDRKPEMTIEDIRIDEVGSTWIEYPGFGSQIAPPDRFDAPKVLGYLRSELPNRDDWQEWLEAHATLASRNMVGHVRLGIACPPDVSIRRAETALKLAEVIDANSAAREMADAA